VKPQGYIKEMAKELADRLSVPEYNQLIDEMKKPRMRKINRIKKKLGLV
jgi:hypothetical protein